MARRMRMAIATTATLAAVLSGALPTAAGDQRVTGAAESLSYTEEGTPFVRSGPECKAGLGVASKRHDAPDASDY
jgi:hypothetical protein